MAGRRNTHERRRRLQNAQVLAEKLRGTEEQLTTMGMRVGASARPIPLPPSLL